MKNQLFSNFNDLPELLSSAHLVKLGLYASVDAAYLARLRGSSPSFFKLKKKVLYPKTGVMEFIGQHMQQGDLLPKEFSLQHEHAIE